MSGVPTILVEGADDIKFYRDLAKSIDKEADVIAVDTIDCLSDGCVGVIDCIQQLQSEIKSKQNGSKYIIGIIDKDARYYRGEIPNNLSELFVLKYYSFESHFVTRNHLKYLLTIISNIGLSFIDDRTLDYFENNLCNEYEKLYYISLEALKNACEQGYASVIGYSSEPGYIVNNLQTGLNIWGSISSKKSSLDSFASDRSINFEHLKLIAKGKWLLHFYCNFILLKMRGITSACQNGEIRKCQYCNTGQPDKCLWKMRFSFNLGLVQSLILNHHDDNELGYIKARVKMLA